MPEVAHLAHGCGVAVIVDGLSWSVASPGLHRARPGEQAA